VVFNGSILTPSSVTGTQIAVAIPAANLASTGTFQIAVHNPSGGLSNEVGFRVGDTGLRGVNLVLGIGSLVVGKNTNYIVNSSTNVLAGTVIGGATPQLMAGTAFRLPMGGFGTKTHHSREDPWDVFVSLKFAPGSTQTLNGFVFGLSYRIASHLSVLGGFALSPFSEPSPGFRLAAINAVKNNTNPNAYAGFTVASLTANGPSAFDGFPLLAQPLSPGSSPMTNANLYAGDPLETHYQAGLIVGISVPIALGPLLGYK
jgi:hypothetical protein